MTIAITGATGQLGRLALAAITGRGGSAVALVRTPAKAAGLAVEARAFDYTDPATFDALKGIETLVLISSNDIVDRIGQHTRVIDAAKAAGVRSGTFKADGEAGRLSPSAGWMGRTAAASR